MAITQQDALEYFGLPEFKPAWGKVLRGIEKESLRVTRDYHLAQTPHPIGLGSALTHPYFTTDYSEALLELITPVFNSIDDCLGFLGDLHTFTYQNLPEDEILWVSSMPCLLGTEEQIPLAQYGNSNMGRLKTLYREGLGHRYGRFMQTIAGIHYNFSMPESFWADYQRLKQSTESPRDFQTSQYLHIIRNFHRYSWLLVYLFGASPAVARCFADGREHDLQDLDEDTLYKPYATCLRMGNLGYKSDAQKSIFVCYNELDNYIDSLNGAMATPYQPYEAIGSKRENRYLQINTNLLQLENEFYASIRPKRVGDPGQRPLSLLRKDGIQYIEVRVLDLNPFLPLGIDHEQIRFLDSFLLFCLLAESPQCTETEYFEVERNLAAVVNEGRDPALRLHEKGEEKAMRQWADALITRIHYAAALLDNVHQHQRYSESVAAQAAKLADASLTPSARVLEGLRQTQRPFHEYSMQQSVATREHFMAEPLSEERLADFRTSAAESLLAQQRVEAEVQQDFDEFLKQWNSYRVETA